MTPPTIGLAMIVRNGAETLQRCLASVEGHVDQLVIVLAGESTDDTEKIARQYTKEVYKTPWEDDFSRARNLSFSKLTTDWLFWLDHDDEVQGAEHLRELAADAEASDVGCLHLTYRYRHDERGRPTVLQTRERLMKASVGWTWKDRVHEYCAGLTPHSVGFDERVIVDHLSEEPNRERNMRLLLLMEEEDPSNPRMLGALGDSYQSMGDFDRALEYNERFFAAVDHIDSKWTAATEMARSHIKLKQWDEAESWCQTAVTLEPKYALPYLLLAHVAWYGYEDSERGLRFLGDAESREQAPLAIYRQPNDYTLNRWDVEHRLYADQEHWLEAAEIVGKAIVHLGGSPDNFDMPTRAWRYFWWYYQERINSEKSVQGAFALVNHLFCRGDTLAAREILKNLPVSIREDRRIVTLGEEVAKATAHVFDDGRYARFYGEEHPDSHGVNGSGMEIFRMAPLLRRLQARGAKRVLDVGCGAGGPALWLAEHGLSVTGIDVNPNVIEAAKKEAVQRFGDLAIAHVDFREGTFDSLGPEDLGTFDAVIMMELIEHIHPSKVPFYMSSAEDFLAPGGAVFITTPAMLVGDIPGVGQNFPRDHVKEYTQTDLEGLMSGYPGRRIKLPMSLYKAYDTNVPIPGFACWFMEYESYREADFAEHGPKHWDKPVVIYTGPGLEEWTPETPETKGLGGSETWAVQTARELRQMGYPVVVYGMANGRWDGVIYRHHSMFNPEAPFGGEKAWLCAVSRYVEMLNERPNAEHVVFVAHDVDYGDKLTAERLANCDTYAVMSQWQFSHTLATYPHEPLFGALASRIREVSNGVDLGYFEGTETRAPHSFIWSSSPDRGLDQLLEWWPAIREMWPDATLSIFYGFDNIDAMTASRPWLAPFKARVLEMARQPGVTLRGRLGQRELAREYMKHAFWLYPSQLPEELGSGPWHETFCIAALEAAAAGCIGVFPEAGGLAERPGLRYPGETLPLDAVLASLKHNDETRLEPTDLSDWTWTKAAERLLACVREEVTA